MTEKEKIQELEGQLEQRDVLLSQALTRISELEALVLKISTVKTSQNSHLPPSVDLLRKNQSLREKSENRIGGQKGHKGHTLKMSDSPDIIEKMYPDICGQCGLSFKDLSTIDFELLARRQVIDIPLILPQTIEYQNFGVMCSCGHHQEGNFPEEVTNHVQYGKNIQSLVIYHSYYQFIPFARLQDFFKNVCEVTLSKGTIENIIRRTSRKALPAYEVLKQAIAVSFFVGADETGFKTNGKKGWFWVWQNALVTFIVGATSRAKQVISEVFPEGLPNSILCSDRLAAQLSTICRGNQLCLAHLLRDLKYLIGAEKTPWATEFKILLNDAIKLKQIQSCYEENDVKIIEIEQRAAKLLDLSVLEDQLNDPILFKQTITFFRGMVKLKHALFPFLYLADVPFDNNGSERAFRMVKVKTKVSGQFKSLHQEFAIIRSIIGSAIKNKKPVLNAIADLVALPSPKTAG